MPTIYGIIPARFDSSRFPGKPLVDLKGKPMIQRVWEQAFKSKSLKRVAIATDDKRIAAVAEAFGAEVVMTPKNCPSGSDRVAKALQALKAKKGDIAVNIQGDEPLLPPAMIDQVVELLKKKRDAAMATLCQPLEKRADWLDPNVVKVVMDEGGRALYFSRAAIPHPRGLKTPPAGPSFGRHVGLYAYRVGFLRKFVAAAPSPLEKLEKLEQLRALEMGEAIWVGRTRRVSLAVDTPRDAAIIRRKIR